MRRTAGVTASAVVIIIGSAVARLCGAMTVMWSAFITKANPAARVPENFGSILVAEATFFFGLGGWGLASGIGLLYLKQWARISLLVFAGFLVFVSLPAAALMAVIPLPHDPKLAINFMPAIRVGMALFYGMFAALGGFWLYFFNKSGVKVQFQAMQPVPESAAGDLFVAVPAPAASASPSARPLSITIIGWFLLIGSALAPLGLLMNHALFPGMQVPFYFWGFFVAGRSAYLIFIAWMVAQMAAAMGLLKLRNWGLLATIALQSLGLLNAGLLLVIPGHRAKFQQIMETMMASMNARMPQPAPFDFPAWFGFAAAFPVVVVILWFLITRRHAFTSGHEPAHDRPSVSKI